MTRKQVCRESSIVQNGRCVWLPGVWGMLSRMSEVTILSLRQMFSLDLSQRCALHILCNCNMDMI